MNSYYFATLFDKNYLSRGLALYNSLTKYLKSINFFVLCLDEECKIFLNNNYPEITTFLLEDIEKYEPQLLNIKPQRNKAEYIFTLSPILPLYIFNFFPEIPFITTLDADIFFYSSPEDILKKMEDHSILITPHNFTVENEHYKGCGIYNVSLQAFKRDANGLECLKWWKEKCLDWCFDIPESSRFADQKYLDEFESRFDNVYVQNIEGAGLAPWNINKYNLIDRAGQLYIQNHPVIYYHFHGFRTYNKNYLLTLLNHYKVVNVQHNLIKMYKDYARLICRNSFNNNIERYTFTPSIKEIFLSGNYLIYIDWLGIIFNGREYKIFHFVFRGISFLKKIKNGVANKLKNIH